MMGLVRTCDRCNKKIKYGKFPFAKSTKVKSAFIFGFGVYDYADFTFDLCPTCAKDFEKFMFD